MPLFQYPGFQFNLNCKLHIFHALISSLISVQAVQALGSIAYSLIIFHIIFRVIQWPLSSCPYVREAAMPEYD
jgi:hypothetical protein